jgi:glycosyltransferase involved in cell wall biosynthesis
MRVLYLSNNTSGHNRRFLEKLSQSGHAVWFLDPTTDQLPQNWLPDGVHWIRPAHKTPRNGGPAEFAEFLPEFRNHLKRIRAELVHAGPTHNCCYLTALSGFHPWLLMPWGSDILYYAERNPDWKRATQIALASADGCFFDCNAVRDKVKQFSDIPDSRVVQFPWGIKTGTFGPSGALPTREQFVREERTHVFICTRSWEPVYGIDVLLRAFRQARRQDSSLRLLLLGGGSQADYVRNFLVGEGLTDVVRTPGHVGNENVAKWFRAADTYVSCAQSDGTSISLLEAMATGLPAIVADIPSNREWIVEEHNGWLASAGSSEEFASRLLRAARLSQPQRELISDRNRDLVAERADWDRNFPRLLEMYKLLASVPTSGDGASLVCSQADGTKG